MEHPSLQFAECPTAMKSCSDIDRLSDAERLYEAVRNVIQSPVHLEWCDVHEQWEVDVEGVVVWSVAEALEVTKHERDSDD